MSVRLDAESVEAIARRVIELQGERLPGGPLVDVETVARYLDVEAGWVYEHADELGVRRLGAGARPRLRFDLAEVDRRLASCSEGRESDGGAGHVEKPIRRRRARASLGTGARLLPIRGDRQRGDR